MATTVEDVLDKLYFSATVERDKRDKGDKFERMMVQFFTTEDVYADRFSDIFMWMDWPERACRKDNGIDLVNARTAVEAVGANVYLLGETSDWSDAPSSTDLLGNPLHWNTAVFAFRADGLGTDEPSSQRHTPPHNAHPPPVELGVAPDQSVGGSS